jgi:rhodanese-related sulfurtransferase
VPSHSEIPEVEPKTAFDQYSESAGVILDVRESEELAQISVQNAMHIPLGELHLRVDELPRDRDVYVLCHVGQRSAMATEFLQQLGHHRVANVRGGIVAWVKSGLPVVWGRDR